MTARQRFAIQALLWSSYFVVSIGGWAAYGPITGTLVFVMLQVSVGLWLISEGLRRLALRGRWLDLSPLRLLLRLLFLPMLASLLLQIVIYAINSAGLALGWLQFPDGSRRGSGLVLVYAFNTSVMLWLWLAVWGGVQWLQRWRLGEIAKWQADAAARALELQVLRSQINPHFLFNALNNLRALINEDPARAREMVGRLSNTLRHTLQHTAQDRVPLAAELAVVRDYIALEQLHHEERLQVDWHIDPPSAEATASVPPMLLQLLVENAIKHGIARTPGGGVVGLRIEQSGPRLQLAVSNPGRWAPGPAPADDAGSASTGLGLANLRERLRRAGGPGADCRIDSADGRVTVTVELSA